MATVSAHGKCQVTACNIRNEKQQITELSVSPWPTGSVSFPSTENHFSHWFLGLNSIFFLKYPFSISLTSLPQWRWRWNMERADWPWNIYDSLIVWVLTAEAHYCDPIPKQKAWCVAICCDLDGWVKVHAVSPYIESPSVACFLLSVYNIYIYLFSRLDSLSCAIWSFSTIFSNMISPEQSVLAFSPLSAFSPHSISHPISSTLSSLHHIHNDRLTTASAVPLSYNKDH